MIKLKHKVVAAGLAVAMVLGAAGVAEADEVRNNVVADGNGTIVEGASTTISYFIQVEGAGADRQGGCNAADGSAAKLTISAPTGVTLTSAATGWDAATKTLTFTACNAKSVTFSAAADGTYGITHVISDTGTGRYTNAADWTLNVTNVSTPADTTAPTLSGKPSNIVVEATSASGAVATWTSPTATDDVDPDPVVTCAPTSGSTFALGTATVSCTARDAAGNESAAQTFTVTVGDTTAPTLTGVPTGGVGAEATGADGAAVSWRAPTATDAVDPAPVVTCTPASGSTFPVGQTNVACTATDAAGNQSSVSFSVTVTDTEAPVFAHVPANQTLEATSANGAVATWTDPTATDIVDGTVPVACAPASGHTFALGATTVTCTATDAAGNVSSKAFTVTVMDTTPPVIAGTPSDATLEATGPTGAASSWTAPTAIDAVDGTVLVSCAPPSGSTFALGTTTVTCTATDTAGNSSQTDFDRTVRDTTAPSILGVPGNQTLEATGPLGAAATWAAPTASDLVDGGVGVVCTAASGDTFALGTTTVTCTGTDAAGNTGTASFTITVEDTTAPTVTFVGGPSEGGSYLFGSVPAAPTCTATDLVDADVPCIVTGYASTVGPQTMTASAADDAGNTGTATRSYTVTPWTVRGFYSPVDGGTIVNTVKAGATVPLKFEVFAGSVEQTSTSLVSFKAVTVGCSSLTADVDEVELRSTGGTSLRYDTTAGQYIQNWQTPKAVGGCYKVTMSAADGSSTSALFKLK